MAEDKVLTRRAIRRILEVIVVFIGIVAIILITNALDKPIFGYLIAFIIIALIVIGYLEFKDEDEDFAQPAHTSPRPWEN